MLEEFFLKKMMQKQLAGVPAEQQEKIIRAISENPELFQKIGNEMQEKIKAGGDQMSVAMEVMGKYKEELKRVM